METIKKTNEILYREKVKLKKKEKPNFRDGECVR